MNVIDDSVVALKNPNPDGNEDSKDCDHKISKQWGLSWELDKNPYVLYSSKGPVYVLPRPWDLVLDWV